MKTSAQITSRATVLVTLSLMSMGLTSCFTQKKSTVSAGASVSADAQVRWNSSSIPSNGIDVKISQEILNDFVSADNDSNGHNPVEQIFAQWNGATTTETFYKIPTTSTNNLNYSALTDYRDSVMGIYKSHNWFSNVQSSVLAVTQYYGYRRNAGTSNEYIELSHADIIMNYRDYNFSTNASDTSTYDFHSVVLHELGHFLGLIHTKSYSIDSVMQPSLAISASKRAITTYDKATIVERYGGSSALSATSALSTTSSAAAVATTIVLPKAVRQISNAGEIHGLIELRSNGQCRHLINDKVVSIHHVKL